MQLFLIDIPVLTGSTITLSDSGLIHQISRVLRMKPGSTCFLQWNDVSTTIRAEVTITAITKKEIICTILSQESKKQPSTHTRLAIARPNKPVKMEMIVQKLTELGLDEIIFFKAERSHPGTWNDKKAMRIYTIIKEATEQCRGRTSPVISYYDAIEDIPDVHTCVVADIPDRLEHTWGGEKTGSELFFIGPEGGRGDSDYSFFAGKNVSVLELGDRVLRMETAAIVVGSRVVDMR